MKAAACHARKCCTKVYYIRYIAFYLDKWWRFLHFWHRFCVILVTLQENPHCITPGKWQYQSSPLSYIGNSLQHENLALYYGAGLWIKQKPPIPNYANLSKMIKILNMCILSEDPWPTCISGCYPKTQLLQILNRKISHIKACPNLSPCQHGRPSCRPSNMFPAWWVMW